MDGSQGYLPIKVKGQIIQMSEQHLGELIKQKMRSSRSIMALFEEFEVDPSRLDDLQIFVRELDNKYAETDGRKMVLNTFLFSNGDFFERYFFIVAHEIVHWLSRIREQDSYFNDPEEVLGFVSSIAYELDSGDDLDTVWNKVYPKISWHFHNEEDARAFFGRMMEKAQKLLTEAH
jgi:diadenosine tetraphosphatase ApaH/serine/threonine PP2A family protein phosphatase